MVKTNGDITPAVEKEIRILNQSGLKPEPHQSKISVLEIIGTATRGGMENYLVSFFKNLPLDKFNIVCICPCESLFTRTLRELGIDQIFIAPLADDPEWRSVQTAMEVCKLYQVDVLHAHMPKSHVLAAIAGSLLRKPVVATLHGMHVTAHELGVALAAKSHLITNCQETYIQALALGVPAERVKLFHNGVDTTAFAPGKAGVLLRQQIGVPADSVLVGFVGRLEYEKGPDLFVRAAAQVHELLPNVQFVVVGAGSMLKELKHLAQTLQLQQHLHFADWCSDAAAVYPQLDLVAHCSRNDGTSLVLLEAMACAKPVVAMAVGGIREIIENEHSGLLATAGNWAELGSHIVHLLQEPEVAKNMGLAARQRVETSFNVQLNTQKTADLLQRIAIAGVGDIEQPGNYQLQQVVKLSAS